MTGNKMPDNLDRDQESILAVYSFYTQESKHSYLQYTAACALFFYLTQKGFFKYNLDELLVYDYKESRRYIWEAKKFMADINILRDQDLLIRARSRSKTYRDVNAHQCSDLGHAYIKKLGETNQDFADLQQKLKATLSTDRGELYDIRLDDKGPILVNEREGGQYVSFSPIQGFLKDLCPADSKKTEGECVEGNYKPFFI